MATSKKSTSAKSKTSASVVTKAATPRKVAEKAAAPAVKAVKPAVKKVEKPKSDLKVPKESFYGTGRRKSSIAKVWIFKGTGRAEVNGQTLLGYYKREILVESLLRPLKLLNMETKFDIRISTLGGGLSGQSDAAQLGIARAVVELDANFKKQLKDSGFLTRDSRIKERKKYGRKRARKGYQFRKR